MSLTSSGSIVKGEVVDVEAFIIIDADGHYEVASDLQKLQDLYVENLNENEVTATRLIKVTLKVPVPKVVELVAEVEEEAALGELVTTG